MNDTPEWIAQRNAQKKSDAEQAARQAQLRVQESAIYAAQGPEVWQRFVNALKVNADALSKLDEEELFGATTLMGTPPVTCQVNVDRRSVVRSPQLSYLVFHYERGSNVIRITRPSGEESSLHMRKGPDNIVGFFYQNRILAPEKMAETVIQKMVDGVSR